MPADSPALGSRSPATRSRIGNGSALLAGIDGRSAGARRYRDLIESLTADIGGDLGEAEKLQVRGAASLQLHLEELTSRVVRGEFVDSEAITRASNAATRALLALKRRQVAKKPIGPSLDDYLATSRAGAVEVS